MKILKKAKQKNFVVNEMYYTDNELQELQRIKLIYCNTNFFSGKLRVFHDDIKEVKVVLSPQGFYTNVAITKDGTPVYINL